MFHTHIIIGWYRGEEAKRNLTEQEIRIDYFSGLLAEAQTVQEEEEERLQELTAFQQFLAAVTPAQSLQDLKRRMNEIQEEVKVLYCIDNIHPSMAPGKYLPFLCKQNCNE